MSTEFLDVVDEQNQLIGISKLRTEVHEKGYWHRTVHIYVVNNKGDFLVHKRSPHKDSKPNCLDPRFGGHIKAGESVEHAAVQELAEEIGLNIQFQNLRPGPVSKYDGTTNREFSYAFFYVFNDNTSQLKFQDNEVVSVQWMQPDEILKSIHANPANWAAGQTFKEIVNFYKNYSQ